MIKLNLDDPDQIHLDQGFIIYRMFNEPDLDQGRFRIDGESIHDSDR